MTNGVSKNHWKRIPADPFQWVIHSPLEPHTQPSNHLIEQHAPQRILQRLVLFEDVLSQDIVNHHLVAAADSADHLVASPLQHLVVNTDGDARLAGRWVHRTPVAFTKNPFQNLDHAERLGFR